MLASTEKLDFGLLTADLGVLLKSVEKALLTPESHVNISIPQGSILLPFFFILYIYDIFKCLDPDVKILIYADDIVIYEKGDNPDCTTKKLPKKMSI